MERPPRLTLPRITPCKQLSNKARAYAKGTQLYIEGKLQTREWEKDGIKRFTTEVHVDMRGSMQLLGGKPQGQQPGQAPDRQPRQQRPSPQQQSQQAAPPDNFDDDIPFAPMHHLAGA